MDVVAYAYEAAFAHGKLHGTNSTNLISAVAKEYVLSTEPGVVVSNSTLMGVAMSVPAGRSMTQL